MVIRNVMHPAMLTLRPADTLQRARAALKLFHAHSVVVVDEDGPVGIVFERDLEGGDAGRVDEIMHRGVVPLETDMPLARAAPLLLGRATTCIAAMHCGVVVGTVTLADLLEQVVIDEKCPRHPQIARVD